MIENALALIGAAAEPTQPDGDAFSQVWWQFMPRAKQVQVHGVPVVLESMDSTPFTLEALLPDRTTYILMRNALHGSSCRIGKLGHRVDFKDIPDNVPARAMLSRFLQTIVEDWKRERVTAAAEPQPNASKLETLVQGFNRFAARKPTLKVGDGKAVLESAELALTDVHQNNRLVPVVGVSFRCFNYAGNYCGRQIFKVAASGAHGYSVHLADYESTVLGHASTVDAILRLILKSFNGVTIAAVEPGADPLYAVARVLESWIGRVYTSYGSYTARLARAEVGTETTGWKKHTIILVTQLQNLRDILGTTPHHVVVDVDTDELVVLRASGNGDREIARTRVQDPTQGAKFVLHAIATKADPLRSWK